MAAANYYEAGHRAFEVGYIHHTRREADAVLACADRVAAHWTKAKAGIKERAGAIRLRGFGYQLKKDYSAAIAAHHEVLDLHRSFSAESSSVAIILTALANVKGGTWRLGLCRGALSPTTASTVLSIGMRAWSD